MPDRKENLKPWHVATTGTSNGMSNALVVAALSSLAERCVVLEKQTVEHKKGNVSQLLCAKICFHGKVGGREKVRVLCLHLHHSVAKKVSDEQQT